MLCVTCHKVKSLDEIKYKDKFVRTNECLECFLKSDKYIILSYEQLLELELELEDKNPISNKKQLLSYRRQMIERGLLDDE